MLENLENIARPRVCAVSYLNTVPLIWGMEHGEQSGVFNLNYALPSACADQLASGQADIGIVPVIEMERQKLEYFRGTGIASHGPVRSILLVSKVPFRDIKTLATDLGSRTSVTLARIILAEKFGATPHLISMPPELASMLGVADAALLIGDAALQVDPATLPFASLDLGNEWTEMTGLPMVFAVWSGRKEVMLDRYAQAFIDSCQHGLAQMSEIVRREAPLRRVSEELARAYLTRHIVFELGERDYQGMNAYLKHAAALGHVQIQIMTPAGVSL